MRPSLSLSLKGPYILFKPFCPAFLVQVAAFVDQVVEIEVPGVGFLVQQTSHLRQ